MNTPDGIARLNPGTELQVLEESGPTVEAKTREGIELSVPANQLSNDLDFVTKIAQLHRTNSRPARAR